MADSEIIAAILTAGLLQARAVRRAARAVGVPLSAREMVLAEDAPDVEEAVRLYGAVLIELGIRVLGDPGPPEVADDPLT